MEDFFILAHNVTALHTETALKGAIGYLEQNLYHVCFLT